jgi:hypothetical protein
MTVTPSAAPSGRRHQHGKVTLATVEAAFAKLGPGASMRAVQGVTGGSFRDVHAVVHLVRGRASMSVQEALVAGHPADFGQTLVDALRKLEDVAGEIRATQEQQRAQLTALEDAVRRRNRPRDDARLLRALDALQHDLDTVGPDLAKVAAKDPMALRCLLAGLESRLIEAIGEVSKATPALIPASLPPIEPDLLKDLQSGVAAIQHTAVQIKLEQQQLATSVSALHRDLVERHAHHAQRLSESDGTHQRELAHVHRHVAALRVDVGALQTEVGTATERLMRTHRTQGAATRKTLRQMALDQLRQATIAAAPLGKLTALVRRALQSESQRPPVRRRVASATRPKQTPSSAKRKPLARRPAIATHRPVSQTHARSANKQARRGPPASRPSRPTRATKAPTRRGRS